MDIKCLYFAGGRTKTSYKMQSRLYDLRLSHERTHDLTNKWATRFSIEAEGGFHFLVNEASTGFEFLSHIARWLNQLGGSRKAIAMEAFFAIFCLEQASNIYTMLIFF